MHQETFDQQPQRVDFIKAIGDDIVIAINLKENGVAVPNAEWTYEFGLVTSQGAAVSEDFTATRPVEGQLVLTLGRTQTETLGKGAFIYWVSITRNNVELTYVNGEIELRHKWEMR